MPVCLTVGAVQTPLMRRTTIPLHDIPSAPPLRTVHAPHSTHQQLIIAPHLVLTAAAELGPCTTQHLLDRLGYTLTRANEMAVAGVLRRAGYSRVRLMVKGVRSWVFFPPAT